MHACNGTRLSLLEGIGLISQCSSSAPAQTCRLLPDSVPVCRLPASVEILQVLKFAKDLAIEQLQIEEVGCLGKTRQVKPGMRHALISFHLLPVSAAHLSVKYTRRIYLD